MQSEESTDSQQTDGKHRPRRPLIDPSHTFSSSITSSDDIAQDAIIIAQ